MIKEFNDRVDRLTKFVKEGAVDNQAAILSEMEGFAHKNEAIRHFLEIATSEERYRSLTSAQSFYLYGNSYFRMRINAWYPMTGKSGRTKEGLESYFTIDRCHNHSFDFFTVGIFGPGYTTEFKETSQNLEDMKVGDEIEFDNVWDEQLEMGKALYVPKSTLFHTQMAPSDYSISLNLVVDQVTDCLQFEMDDDRKTIKTVFDLIGIEQTVARAAES